MLRMFLNLAAITTITLGGYHVATPPPAYALLEDPVIEQDPDICCTSPTSRCCGYSYCSSGPGGVCTAK